MLAIVIRINTTIPSIHHSHQKHQLMEICIIYKNRSGYSLSPTVSQAHGFNYPSCSAIGGTFHCAVGAHRFRRYQNAIVSLNVIGNLVDPDVHFNRIH